jgi:ubiquinol-cytochrome c reductase iron-sulfur subunit
MLMSEVDNSKRTWMIATGCTGAVGGLAAAIPFVNTFSPSERALAAGAAVEVDIADLKPGEKRTVEWRGKPVWIIHRTKEMLDGLTKLDDKLADPKSDKQMQPEYCKNDFRSIKPEILVAVGICTHLGCSPTEKFKTGAESGIDADWAGGFLCPCHGSTFDLAGRVYKSKPAPDNLEIPPHRYLSDAKIVIGEDTKGA